MRQSLPGRETWKISLAACLLVTAPAPAHSAPAQRAFGKALFDTQCGTCHEIGLGAIDGEGPQLNGIIGNPAAIDPTFAYSPAMRRSAVVWDRKAFETFIANPRATIPGTRMTIPGVTSKAERDAIFAYVASFGGDGTVK